MIPTLNRAVFLSLVALLCVLNAQVTHAEQQYWVTVGSFRSADTAEMVRKQASTQLAESFSVIGAQTENGYFYRVAAGPYPLQMARNSAAAAKSGDYAAAWIWAEDAGTSTANMDLGDDNSGDYSSEYSSEYSTEYGTDYRSALDLDLPDYGADAGSPFDYDASIPAEAELIEKREATPQMVEEAPPGYKLNKLNREEGEQS